MTTQGESKSVNKQLIQIGLTFRRIGYIVCHMKTTTTRRRDVSGDTRHATRKTTTQHNDEMETKMARKVNTKVCTFTRESYPATPEFFYRDKSQKDGLSPWSKIGEAAYNNAYHKALKALGVTRVRDLDDASRVKFDNAMKRAKVRIARTGRVARDGNTSKATKARKRTTRAKASA